jgi:hypothetical protein
MSTSTDEVIEFLGIAGEKGFLNENTVNARRTACNKFFDILDQDQKNVEYIQANLDVIKQRFTNLNREVAGTTVDEYARRVQLVLNDFTAWKADRGAWERSVSAKQAARPAGDGEKKARPTKAEKPKAAPQPEAAQPQHANDPSTRTVEFPLRKDFDVKITLPRDGITMAELRKLAWFLLPYATDFDPSTPQREAFPMLDGNGGAAHA